MKVEIESKPVDTFQPFMIGIEIESKEEAQALWHRLNIVWQAVVDNCHANMTGRDCSLPGTDIDSKLRLALSDYMRGNGLIH